MACDLDDVLAYTTDKQVRVRHRWLGGIYYIGFFAVLLYTVIYQVSRSSGRVNLCPTVHGHVQPHRILDTRRWSSRTGTPK